MGIENKPDNIEHAILFLSGNAILNLKQSYQPSIFHMDRTIIQSLSERIFMGKSLTVKQGKLACVFVKKYSKMLEVAGFDVNDLLINERFYRPLSNPVTITHKIMCLETDSETKYRIDIQFPYNEEIYNKLKNFNRTHEIHRFIWIKDDKKWCVAVSTTVIEFLKEIKEHYNFITDDELEFLFNECEKQKKKVRYPTVTHKDGKLIFSNLTKEQKSYLEKGLID